MTAATTTATRRLVVSPSAELRQRAAAAWLGEQAGGEVLIVAPTRGAADEFARLAVRGGGRFGIHRTNLVQLAGELAAEPMARRTLAALTPLGTEALAVRVVHAVRAEAALAYFEPVADMPGFPRALARTLEELTLQGLEPDRLAESGDAGRDLGRLLTAHRRLLDEGALADRATVFALAAGVARSGRHRLLGLAVLVLDLAPRFAAEEDLLAALVERSPAVLATAIERDEASLAVLARLTGIERDRIEQLEAADAIEGVASRLERLRRYVFVSDAPVPPPGGGVDDSVVFLSAPGEGRECVEIARRIAVLGRSGEPFDGMAVLLRQPEAYQSLIEEALRRAEVPAYFSRGTVRPDPAGRAFLALLACAAEGLSASRFSEYLSLGQVPVLDAAGAQPPHELPWVEPSGEQLVFQTLLEPETKPSAEEERPVAGEEEENDTSTVVAGTLQGPIHWEKLIVDAAVFGGRDRWARRLAVLGTQFRLQLAEVGAEDEGRRAHLERQLERLERLRSFALPVIEALAELPAPATWRVWLETLERLAESTLRRPEPVLAVLAELRPMAAVGPVELDEVRDVLAGRLTLLRAEPPARRYGRVLVATLGEAAGRVFDTVFVPGLAEGIFPRKALEEPLLLDRARRELAAGLKTQDHRIAEERLLLRIAAGAARRRLVVSYPRIDVVQGRSRVPSFYALDVLRAAEGELPRLRDLERRAAEASASPLGWPAPRHPELAIDDAEHDLAVLEPLLRSRTVEAWDVGRARFLLTANPHLARSLRVRAQRWRRPWTAADGLVDADEATRAILAGELPTVRSFSPTALQHFAACPYRFLLQAIHRLRPRDEIVSLEQMDPLTRGKLLHEVQAELGRELQTAGLLPVAPPHRDEILARADAVLDRVEQRYREELAPAIERVWRSEIEGLRTDLRGYLDKTMDEEQEWRPAYFELSFGLDDETGRDPRSQDQPAVVEGGFRLRGSIDLVEMNDDRQVLRVTDHKTGKPPARARLVIDHGEVLQPLLYGLVAETLLGKPVETGRLYFSTQRGEYRIVDVALDGSNRRLALRVLETVHQALETGFLPAAPRDRACEYCDYRLVCGPYEEIRYRLKRGDDRFAGLLEIRDHD